MTRSYFLDCVTEWGELIELCREHDCNICEDIIDEDTLDECVDSDISDCNYGWWVIRDYLSGIPTGYSYYRCDGTFDYAGLNDDDFEDYKSRVLDWMDEDGLWDIEEDEEDDEEEDFDSDDEDDEPEDPPIEEEDFSVPELMAMCGSELLTIRQAAERNKKELDDALNTMLFAV